MATDKTNNLTSFVTGIADTIRTVENSTDKINPQDFEQRITDLPGKVRPIIGRASTTMAVSADDTNDKLTISASNNQQTGYVTGSNQTASTVVTLTASGKTVTATATDGTKISKNVSTVTRANTTMSATVDDSADTITFTGANNQSTGYVTGSNKTAAGKATLSQGTPSINSSTGVVTATATMSENVGSKSVTQSKTLQLTTKGATTITPSDTEQTAVSAGTYTTGDVKVAAMPMVDRASTTLAVTANDSTDTLAVSAENNQGTGYVAGSNETASTTITLTASGKTVTATATDGTKISKDVATVTRASTTLTSSADDTNDKITFTASNNQGTGYVTGSKKTATKSVTLSVGTPTINEDGEVTAVATMTTNDSSPVTVTQTSAVLDLNADGTPELTVSGPTVTASAGYYPAPISESVDTVARANTTISTTADDTNDKLTISASNNQGTGYVTGANKTASTTVTLTASGKTVTATTTDGKSVSKNVTTASRANTNISVAADDTNDTLTISASNNQSTGYVTGADKTASTTVTLTTSGPEVTATATDGTKVSKSVATVTRANTTLSSVANTTNNTLDFTASNNQGTGYVTGANKTATRSVSLSQSGATVTATDGTNYISTSIPSGSYSASGGGLSAGSGSVSATGTNVTLTEVTSKPNSGYCVTAQGSGIVSRAAITKSASAGYVTTGSSTVSNETSTRSNVATKYYKIETESKTVTPKTTVQTVVPSTNKLLSSVTVNATPSGAYSSSATAEATADVTVSSKGVTLGSPVSTVPTSGNYITVVGSSTAEASSTAQITTAGYLSTGTKTDSDVDTASVTKYYPIDSSFISPSGTYTVSTDGTHDVTAYRYASVANGAISKPSISINSSGLILASGGVSKAGWVEIADTSSQTKQLSTQGATTITPTTSEQTAVSAGVYTTGAIKVAAISGVDRAPTTISVVGSDSTDTMAISASNNQTTGYVTGSNETASTTITLTASGKTVTASASDGTKISKDVSTATRASTTATTTANSTKGTLTISASNNQGTGYVTGSNKTASKVVTLAISDPTIDNSGVVTAVATATDNSSTPVKVQKTATLNLGAKGSSNLTASGATVSVPAGYYPSGASKSVSTVTRANTTISTSADTTNNKLTISASNNQGTGYVTGSNKTASTDVTLTCYTPFVNTATGVISSSASAIATDGTQVSDAANYNLTTQGAMTVTPSRSEQTAVSAGVYTTGAIKVGPIPSTYVEPAEWIDEEENVQPRPYDISYESGTYFQRGLNVLGDENLKPENIKAGVSIFGTNGTYVGANSGNAKYSAMVLTKAWPTDIGRPITYGFRYDSSLRAMVPQNKGVNSSFALCRVLLEVKETCDITLEVMNYAEARYDFGIISNLGKTLSQSYDTDSSTNVKKAFSAATDNKNAIQEVVFSNVSAGSYFFEVKYKKDSSTSTNSDTFYFRFKEVPFVTYTDDLASSYVGYIDAEPTMGGVTVELSCDNTDYTFWYLPNQGEEVLPSKILEGQSILGVAGTAKLPQYSSQTVPIYGTVTTIQLSNLSPQLVYLNEDYVPGVARQTIKFYNSSGTLIYTCPQACYAFSAVILKYGTELFLDTTGTSGSTMRSSVSCTCGVSQIAKIEITTSTDVNSSLDATV